MATPEQWSASFNIGSVGISNNLLTSSTVLRDGWIVTTWWNASSQLKYRVFNVDGTAFNSEVVINSADEKPLEQPNVAASWDGRFMIAYNDHDADTRNHALMLKKYDVFTGLTDGSVVDNVNNTFGSVLSPFSDGSYNITYNNYVDGIRYYHSASQSGSATSYYGEADGDYQLAIFGAGAISVAQTDYANLYRKTSDEGTDNLYINIRKKNGDSIAKKFVASIQLGANKAAIAALSNGNYAVVYVDDSNRTTLKAQIFSPFGILLSGEIVLYQSDIRIMDLSVQRATNGGFVFGFTLQEEH